MRLIHTTTLSFKEVTEAGSVPYAILSHRWEKDEVTYKEMTKNHDRINHKRGYQKLVAFCEVAKQLHYDYVWIDTCCIDKRSSAELSEAINSMFSWYMHAGVCCAYLYDLLTESRELTDSYWEDTYAHQPEILKFRLSECEWFDRAWTLQELISPTKLRFYDSGWNFVGMRDVLAPALSAITDIPSEVLGQLKDFRAYSIAERMSWAGNRRAERIEDIAYSLLGLFDVNMPLLYGEGSKAFARLQEQIIRQSNDQSIFIWSMPKPEEIGNQLIYAPPFAPNPSCFSGDWEYQTNLNDVMPYMMTNRGLSITVWLYPWVRDTYVCALECSVNHKRAPLASQGQAAIFLKKARSGNVYRRVAFRKDLWRTIPHDYYRPFCRKEDIYIDSVPVTWNRSDDPHIFGIMIDDMYSTTSRGRRQESLEDYASVYALHDIAPSRPAIGVLDDCSPTLAVISFDGRANLRLKTVVIGLVSGYEPSCIFSVDDLLPAHSLDKRRELFMDLNRVCWGSSRHWTEDSLDYNLSFARVITTASHQKCRIRRVEAHNLSMISSNGIVFVLLSEGCRPSNTAYYSQDDFLPSRIHDLDPSWVAMVFFEKMTLKDAVGVEQIMYNIKLAVNQSKEETSKTRLGLS